jgi:sialate O-acetylesterase
MELAKIFTDNMVLQANKPIYIFGNGNGTVKIQFLEKEYIGEFHGERWEMQLPSIPYGGPYEMRIQLSGETKTLKNVMVGEVLLVAGQSNVQFTIGEEICDDPYKCFENLRFFNSTRIEAYEGIKSEDGWVICAENNLKYWSAVGYHVARFLHEHSGVAVGVIGCFQGASIIQSWIAEEIISRPEYYLPEEQCSFNKNHGEYALYSQWNQNGLLYKATFRPIVPYGVGNVIWYQGCSNTGLIEAREMYSKYLQVLAESWRKDLRDDKLPFIIIQIADLDGQGEGWKVLQNAQAEAASLIPNAKLIISRDISETTTIHPVNKLPLSERIFHAIVD